MAFGDVESRIRTKETDGTDNGLLDSSGQTPQERVCLSCLHLHQLVSSTTCANAMAATSAGTPQANETVVVHCGFYSKHGGFRIFDEDKSHMHTCIISTCAFGSGDDLYQPIGMTEGLLCGILG
ncbi:Uncharacterized protein M6B38_248140 [Iris pallida]|uniref:TOD1/MUCI70 glycosyltransferase-like domain-containing protein n=1 Tax=Iris pallida TaxID=29817 RepID=A0AAX6DGF1_IRIPA|nr:Uncharacterized protein M6B38_248140 [Iris pallida]